MLVTAQNGRSGLQGGDGASRRRWNSREVGTQGAQESGTCMRKGGVRAEGVGYELSPVRVPEVQTRAVVRTHLVDLLVLLVLRREAE